MINTDWLQELSARLKEVAATSPAQDIERNMRALLSATFSRFNLVTREEFDAQSATLAHTRAKLEALERLVTDLENKIKRGD